MSGHHHQAHEHGHTHAVTHAPGARPRLLLSLLITLIFTIVEAVAGTLSHSLALMTDAAHNLTDVAALALSWYALRVSSRPAHAGKTYGYHRVGILAALANSMTLVVIAAGIAIEASRRFSAPEPVDAGILMSVSGIALGVNLLTAWLVGHGAGHDLNVRSAFLHLMGDVLSTLGALLAGAGIYFTGLDWLDPLASLLIALLILWNAWLIVRETLEILLESTPRDIEMSEMVRDLMQVAQVRGVHDLHVWSLSSHLRFLSVHVQVDDMPVSQTQVMRHQLTSLIEHRYGIAHTTIQFETAGSCADNLYCNISPGRHLPSS